MRSWPLAALVAAAALAGCGGEDEPAGSSTPAAAARPTTVVDVNPVGLERAGSYAQQADCAAWKAGTREQRMATIRDIRGQTTPQTDPDAKSPLPDVEAYKVFQHACKPEWANSLRLYKLYFRVQGFAPLRGAVDG
jgi:hypothetical protein